MYKNHSLLTVLFGFTSLRLDAEILLGLCSPGGMLNEYDCELSFCDAGGNGQTGGILSFWFIGIDGFEGLVGVCIILMEVKNVD